jgi:predicted PurR-regulated permease PerM
VDREDARRRTLYLTVVAALVLYLAYLARDAVVPLLVALLLAYLLAPLVAVLERRGLSRIWAVTTLFVAFFGTTGAALFFGLPPLFEEGRALLRATLGEPVVTLASPLPTALKGLPDHKPPVLLGEFLRRRADAGGDGEADREHEGTWERKLREARETRGEEGEKALLARHGEWVVGRRGEQVVAFDDWNRNGRFDAGYVFDGTMALSRRIRDRMRNPALAASVEDVGIDAAPNLADSLVASGGDVARGALDVLGTLLRILGWLVIVPLYTFCFLMRLEDVWAAFVANLPGTHRDRVIKVLLAIHRMLIGFFRGRLLTIVAKGIYVGVGLALVGAPYWPVFGALAALFTIVPAVGWLVAAVPAVILSNQEGGTTTAVMAAGVLLSAEFVEGYIFIPKMIGKEVGLHPLAIIASVLIGGALLGIFGVVIAIPLAASAKIVWEEFVVPAIRAKAAEPPRPPDRGRTS